MEEDRESLQGALRAVLQTGEAHAFACRIVRPDGTLRVCRGQLGAVRDEAGRPRLILGALRNTTLEDATVRIPDDMLVRALREQRTELLSLVDAAPIALLLVDASQRILRANRATERMFGCRVGELLGRGLETLFSEPGELVDALLYSPTAREERVTRAVSLVKREGWPFRAEMTVVAASATENTRFAVTFAAGVLAAPLVADVNRSPWDGFNPPRVDAPSPRR